MMGNVQHPQDPAVKVDRRLFSRVFIDFDRRGFRDAVCLITK
jgi:hypothetical protein